jgi:hypothetical protein
VIKQCRPSLVVARIAFGASVGGCQILASLAHDSLAIRCTRSSLMLVALLGRDERVTLSAAELESNIVPFERQADTPTA